MIKPESRFSDTAIKYRRNATVNYGHGLRVTAAGDVDFDL